MPLEEIALADLDFNFANEFATRYCLVSATREGKTNMLTAAWGQVGFLWKRPVATLYIRPSRYTKEFMDASGRFTISFIEGHEKDMIYLGRHSGRDGDKLAQTSLHLVDVDGDPTYEEASLVLVCKTIYVQPLDLSCALDPAIESENYPNGDVSIQYIGQIEKVLTNGGASANPL